MKSIATQLQQHRQYLPHGYELWDFDGQTLYPIYAMSGGIASKAVFYLVHDGRVLGVRIKTANVAGLIEEGVVIFLDRAIQFGIDNFDTHAIPLNLDGGDLGLGIEFIDKDTAHA